MGNFCNRPNGGFAHEALPVTTRLCPPVEACPTNVVNLYHSTTLAQCQQILAAGFTVGLYHKGSRSSPCGIWGCNKPGHAFDRSRLNRGWSIKDGLTAAVMCGWDCPMAFGWSFSSAAVQTHRHLSTGKVLVHKLPLGTQWDVRSRRTEIWINSRVLERFSALPAALKQLQQGRLVVCRARRKSPHALYRAGHASPMTCGRTCETPLASGWTCAEGTHQFVCPFCQESYLKCRPCTEAVIPHGSDV